MFDDKVTARDLDTAARTIWGEARGEDQEGRIAVAHVLLNRVRKGGWWGDTLNDVCRTKWQFSCWNEDDPNLWKIENVQYHNPDLQACLAALLVAMQSDDTTNGACHYHTKAVAPDWADTADSSMEIGNHIFLTGVK